MTKWQWVKAWLEALVPPAEQDLSSFVLDEDKWCPQCRGHRTVRHPHVLCVWVPCPTCERPVRK